MTECICTSGNASVPGVLGENSAEGGRGVVGNGVGATGIGVLGQNDLGVAVYGNSRAGTGIVGESQQPSGQGVLGENRAEGGRGVVGNGFTATGIGVLGQNGAGVGVYGNGVTGIWGESTRGGAGVSGSTTSSVNDSVAGVSGNNTGDGYAVLGKGGVGVRGEGSVWNGVEGINTSGGVGFGVYGDGGPSGAGVAGTSNHGPGVAGDSVSGAAGYFGNGWVYVLGDITVAGIIYNTFLAEYLHAIINELDGCCGSGNGGGAGSGNFLIDHPLDPANRLLSHVPVKCPELKNLYDGVATLDANGEAVVQLPPWFRALNSAFRYQLTAVGAPAPNLHVVEQAGANSFKISGGTRGMQVCWQATGVRQDPEAKAHPLNVEKDKAPNERGYYVHPLPYGQPADRDIRWLLKPEWMKKLLEVQTLPETTLRVVQQRRDAQLEQRLTRAHG
jgi:hypothetical protein